MQLRNYKILKFLCRILMFVISVVMLATYCMASWVSHLADLDVVEE
jgi:hypothetical protein